MLTLADIALDDVAGLLARYGLGLRLVAAGEPIPGSYWGECEAGLIGTTVFARMDTPVHSLLHEACHLMVIPPERRASVHTDASDSQFEEDATCYLQLLLADRVPGFGRERAFADMDAWGYTFRLGSARAWFENDAEDAAAFLHALPHLRGLLDARATPEAVLGRGANRLCVLDPSSPAHCLKYELPDGQRTPVGLRRRLQRALARRFRRSDNALELRAWHLLQARLGAALDAHVARCEEIVETAQGPALRCALVRNGDGQPAASLNDHLNRLRRIDGRTLVAALDAFEAWLMAHRVGLFDVNGGNLVVVEPGDGAAPRLACVDLKSTLHQREVVPFSRWFPALGRRKVRRRIARLRNRILAIAPPSCLAPPPPAL